ncbi:MULTISPECIES: response regulator transcription factor [Robinsoniella]|uniref:Stage 0 sporulation protein A homolog n=1 Tax=Robinsoniella peoriensis TaxID=180332 RepID=A0A4U8Q523_9FIRM|nr:response regulator [Robinsoniella peoriensis]MDU7027590.1 response regulator [Clostridiales bacterium]TLC99102.1 putative response regulatory protein [Robinsoniella peoriensis]
MKLLIVDDEIIIRKGLESLSWESVGITEKKMSDSGVDALQMISSFCPDIILTDIRMPGLDGLQLAREIATGDLRCKMILLSGYGTFEYAKQAIHSGVFEYLLKPSSPEEILDAVHRAVKELEVDKVLNRRDAVEQEKDEMFATGEDGNGRWIMDYIEKNYMNEITLTSLAEHTHFSITYLSRLIKKETNYNFTKLLGIVRMLKAAELLANTDLKIYVICERIGINDQRYFSQLFRKTFGKTPMEYRKCYVGCSEGSLIEFIRKSDRRDL